MTGENCDEVVEALALTAALSIDPHATLTLGPASQDPKSDKHLRPEKPQKNSEEAEHKTGPQEKLELTLGPSASIEKLVDTAVHVSGAVFVSLSRLDGGTILPLEAKLSLFGSTEISGAPSEGIVTRRLGARLAYCPLRFGRELSLLACPFGDVGLLFASSRGFEEEERATRLHAQVGGEASLRARVGRHGSLWLSPALSFPLTRREFAIEPGPEVLTSTVPVGWRVSSGIGWVF
jgi:hypothetical protein